jgi:hypothetical protein
MDMSDLDSAQHQEMVRRVLTDTQRFVAALEVPLQQMSLTDLQTAEFIGLRNATNALLDDGFVPDDTWIAHNPLPSATKRPTFLGQATDANLAEAIAIIARLVEVLDLLTLHTQEQRNDLEVLTVMEANLFAYRLKDSLMGTAFAGFRRSRLP